MTREPAGPGVVERAVDALRLRAPWGLGVGVAVLAVAVAVVFLSRPVYRADARLRLGDPPPTAGITPTGGLLSFLRTGGDPFANDLELLGSRTLAEQVVRATALSVSLDAPRGWYRDSVLVSLSLPDTTEKAVYEATWTGPSRVRVRQHAPEKRDVGEFDAGAEASFGGMAVAFAPRRPPGPASVRLRTQPLGDAVRSASSRISVTRTRRDANVLEIAYTHDDPGVALAVVGQVVDRFLRLRTTLFRRESGETVDSLRAVSLETQRELRQAEDALESFQSATGLVALDPQSEALVERYEATRTALEEARTEREALEAQLARVGDLDDPVAAWSVLVAYPRFLENETVGGLLTRLTQLQEARTEARTRLQPGSTAMGTLDEQIRQLDAALRAMAGEYRTALDESIAELQARADTLDTVLASLPGRLVELGRRQRDVRVLSEILVLTEQRLRQEELRQALAYSNVQVIDEPRLRYRPVWPRKKLGLAAGLLVALGSGLLAMVMVHRADTTLRSAARIRALTGAPVLAAPVVAPRTGGLAPADTGTLAEALGDAVLVTAAGVTEREARLLSETRPSAGDAARALRVEDHREAVAAAARGERAVVALRVGATRESDLTALCRLLEEVGVSVAGTVAVCGRSREARRLWR